VAAETAAEDRWLEVRCDLFPRADGPGRFVPWSALAAASAGWRAEGRYDQFFFVRKPPGLRLRFGGDDVHRRLEPVLLPWLTDAERRNDLRAFRFSVYEPEEARFGGPVGMALAHDAFDRDSCDAVQYEALSDDSREAVGRVALSIAITNHLLGFALGDRAEMWDVWHRLSERLGEVDGTPSGGRLPEAHVEHVVAGDVLDPARLSDDLGRLVEHRLDHNVRLARSIVAARDAGRLAVGLRAWLAALTIFHWNRFGVTLELDELRAAVGRMCVVLEPD
jgi:thiopeptide-type bacteriocin biosynthesis protein